MNVFFPWAVLITYQAYEHGIKQKTFPQPSYFVGSTIAMGICALVAQANETFGTVLAWGLVTGAFVSGQFKSTTTSTTSASTGNTSGEITL